MKKTIISGVFALALLVTAGYGVNKSMNGNVNLSDLELLNVEALAQTSGEDFVITCGQYEGPCWIIVPHYIPVYYDCEFSGRPRDYCI